MQASTTRVKRIVAAVATAAFWLLLWQLVSALVGMEMLFPSPTGVLSALIGLVKQARFWSIIAATAFRVIGGFLLGLVVGAALAVAAFRSRIFERFISPIMYIVRSTPVASFIIIALFWLGTSRVPTLICVLMVVPITLTNLLAGLRAVNVELLEMADAFRLGRFKRLKAIYLPSVVPYFVSAASTGLGLSWKAGIAAEVICRAKLSIGNEIFESKLYSTITEMFAWTAVVIVLSVVFDKLLSYAVKAATRRFSDKEGQP